jgi:hypothetical protein
VDVRSEVGGVSFIDFIERGAGGRATNPTLIGLIWGHPHPVAGLSP